MRLQKLVLAILAAISLTPSARAEDGYDLWLRYRPLDPAVQRRDRAQVKAILVQGTDARLQAAAAELERATNGLLGIAPRHTAESGTILLGTPATSPLVRDLRLDLTSLGKEGYVVRSASIAGRPGVVVAGNTSAGVLYGTFALIRHMQRGLPLDRLHLRSVPKLQLRVLNHWDDLNGHVERGYAGDSLWDWWN